VVIAVGATGVCRSDWHAWKGHDPVALPHIGGHELAGVVAAAGPEVTRWRPGDRVTVPFVCGCGRCEFCLAGDAQVCPRQTQPGSTGPGSFAELMAIAVDVADAALDRARELGAEFAVQADQGLDPVTAVSEITGGGAHVSIDALGSPSTAVNSVRCLRRRGRHVQVGLLPGPASTPPIPMDLVIGRELEIYGSHGMAARDYPAMMAMVADGTLRPDLAIGRVIGLEDTGQALAAMDKPGSIAGMTVVKIPF
jgi:D-arabinose 1-dehydrogenase-like Zn-dependent alcohol dehydrogenase